MNFSNYLHEKHEVHELPSNNFYPQKTIFLLLISQSRYNPYLIVSYTYKVGFEGICEIAALINSMYKVNFGSLREVAKQSFCFLTQRDDLKIRRYGTRKKSGSTSKHIQPCGSK